MSWPELFVLFCLTALGAVLRFYQLSEIPPGFHFDEAFEAVEALNVLAGGYYPIFFRGNFGVDPLFIYLTALAFLLFDASPVVMRGVGALVGTLTVPIIYWLGKELERAAGIPLRGLGLVSAAVTAGWYWHITYSRMGIEPILVPLFAGLTSIFLWRALRTGRMVDFIACGLFLGLSIYTYPAARLLPFFLAAFLVYVLLVRRSVLRAHLKHLAVLWVVALLVVAPLGITFAQEPDLLTLRTQQVVVAAEGADGEEGHGLMLDNIVATMLGISVTGDRDPRNNLPGRPMLDPFLSLLFLFGLLLGLRRLRDPTVGFLVLWLGFMLLPTILSEYAPHFRRAIGAVPPLALLISLPVAAVAGRLKQSEALGTRSRLVMGSFILILVLGYTSSVALAAGDYFVRWGRSPLLFYAYDVGLAEMGQRLAQEHETGLTYISPRSADHPTLAFFLWGQRQPGSFDGRHCFVLPPRGWPATYWIIEHEDWRSPLLMDRYLPLAKEVETILDPWDQVYAQSYLHTPGGVDQWLPPIPTEARFGDWVELRGWQPINPRLKPGEILYVDCYWATVGKAEIDYTVFIHLVRDVYNPATQGPLWANSDRQPGLGSCPTSRWLLGERVVDQVQVQIPDDMPPGEYRVEVGWYDLATMQRLPVYDADENVTGDRLALGHVSVNHSE